MSDQTIAYTIVDAFTSKPFAGNSASVIVMDRKDMLSTETMQLIAREFNLSETAFIAAIPNTKENEEVKALTYSLRWFTPSAEVKICGHATLASARTLFANNKLVPDGVNTLLFETLSGTLKASKIDDGRIELTFPAGEVEPLPSKMNEIILPQTTSAVGKEVEILGLYRGVGSLWEGWLLVELDTKNKNLADLSIKAEVIVRSITSDVSFTADCLSRVRWRSTQ
jgi:PhzF family phenazine biosynthesis protein